jgi:hypothetical protein
MAVRGVRLVARDGALWSIIREMCGRSAETSSNHDRGLRQTGDMSSAGPRMSDDVSPAEWIAPRLTGGFGAVTRTVPCGYPAYARICHPAGARDGGPGYLVGGGPSDRAPDPPGHAVARTRGFSGPPERERVGVARPQPRARELRVLLRRLRRPDQRRLPSRRASHPVSVRRAPAPGRHPRGRQPRDHHRSVRPGAIAATKGQSIGRDVGHFTITVP